MAWATNSRLEMQSSVSEIRRRLLFLLLRAFVIVLFLLFVFFSFILGIVQLSSSMPTPFDSVNAIENYYLTNGSWEGVESVFTSMDDQDWIGTILLDNERRIV